MPKQMGVWICQTKAVVVRLDENGASKSAFVADCDPKRRATGGRRTAVPYVHGSVSSRDRLDALRKIDIDRFFAEVQSSVAEADDLVIFGPGSAKTTFAGLCQDAGLKVRAVEVAGSRLSEAQIVARVMNSFGRPAPRKMPNMPGLAVYET